MIYICHIQSHMVNAYLLNANACEHNPLNRCDAHRRSSRPWAGVDVTATPVGHMQSATDNAIWTISHFTEIVSPPKITHASGGGRSLQMSPVCTFNRSFSAHTHTENANNVWPTLHRNQVSSLGTNIKTLLRSGVSECTGVRLSAHSHIELRAASSSVGFLVRWDVRARLRRWTWVGWWVDHWFQVIYSWTLKGKRNKISSSFGVLVTSDGQ